MSRILMPIVCVSVFLFAGCEPPLVEPVHTQADGGVIGTGTSGDPVRLSPDEQAKLDNLSKMPWNTYIQNSAATMTNTPQAASFNITGTGIIGNRLSIGSPEQPGAKLEVWDNGNSIVSPIFARNGAPPVIGNQVGIDLAFDAQTMRSTASIRAVLETTSGSIRSGALAFRTQGAGGDLNERMRITPNGYLGIGASDPQAKLTIRGTAGSDDSGLGLDSGTGHTWILRQEQANEFQVQHNGITRLTVQPGGNVGIGTPTPSELLVLGDDLGNRGSANALVIGNTQGAGGSAIVLGYSSKATAFMDYGPGGNLRLAATRDGTPSNGIEIQPGTGNVAIGTNDPKDNKLVVAGGDVRTITPGSGFITTSPNGQKCARIGIDNNGAIVVTPLPCQ